MRFGLTENEKRIKQNAINYMKIYGVGKFAFLPVQLASGSHLWLESYDEYYDGNYSEETERYVLTGSARRYAQNDYVTKNKIVLTNYRR